MITGQRLTCLQPTGVGGRSYFRGRFFAAPFIFDLPARTALTITAAAALELTFTLQADQGMVF